MINLIDKNTNFGINPEFSLVAILMCTYNGAQFLADQLDSLEAQTHKNWVVIASDDGSTDQTLRILEHYEKKWAPGKLTIRRGPQKGFCSNFMSLLLDNKILADFYAFCDQDDLWLPEKLTRSLQALENIPSRMPAVYGSRTLLVDDRGLLVGMSPIFARPPSFENALVQSIAGGNTMVLNHAAKLAVQVDPQYDVVSHDWWIYLVITGIGGHFVYDPNPNIYYRQHKNNIVGSKKGFLQKFARFSSLLSNNYKQWIECRNSALESIAQRLTVKNQHNFRRFCNYRKFSLFFRLSGIIKLGIHRQNLVENVGLFAAVFLNKI
jgi:glycosyltransferase involved in cell wall biosynthesis